MEAARVSLRRARPLLGTFVEIAVTGPAIPAMEDAVEAAFAAVATVHGLMSFHETDSDVSRLNRDAASRPVRVHDWTCEVLEVACDLNRRSAGVFDVAVAPALQRLGLLPSVPALASLSSAPFQQFSGAIELLPDNEVRFAHTEVKIDLGGIAKGFAVDRAVDALRCHGVAEGLVNAGGDLRAFGPRRHDIDVRDPRQPEQPICRVALRNGALASSAGRFDLVRSDQVLSCAVVDPATAMPVRAIRGATVRAPSCIVADALTKVVMNAGEAAAPILEHFGADALFLSAGGEFHMTANWKNEVRLAA